MHLFWPVCLAALFDHSADAKKLASRVENLKFATKDITTQRNELKVVEKPNKGFLYAEKKRTFWHHVLTN